MKESLKTFWNNHGWVIIIFSCAIILLLLYFYSSPEDNKTPMTKSQLNFNEYARNVGILKSLHAMMPKFNYDEKILRRKKHIVESKGEKAMKNALEKIYGFPFTKIRPLFLKNEETGRNLEIDAYNDRLKIGAEYNGKQHYTYTPGWHATYEDFAKMQKRDELKRELCRKNGIVLIEIPYTILTEDIENFLRKELKKLGKL